MSPTEKLQERERALIEVFEFLRKLYNSKLQGKVELNYDGFMFGDPKFYGVMHAEDFNPSKENERPPFEQFTVDSKQIIVGRKI